MSSIAGYAAVPVAPRVANRGRFALIGLATVAAATAVNTLFYYIGGLLVTYNPEFLVLANPSGVIIFTVVAAIVAVLVYGGLLRFSANPVRVYNIVAAVVLVVSIVPDITYIPGVEGASNGQAAILALTHVVAAAVIVPMLTILARPQER
jgi:hypothetical protein